MRRIGWTAITACATAIIVAMSGQPAAANCSQIKDADQRWQCRALERSESTPCAQIKDDDARQLCRAQSRRVPER